MKYLKNHLEEPNATDEAKHFEDNIFRPDIVKSTKVFDLRFFQDIFKIIFKFKLKFIFNII